MTSSSLIWLTVLVVASSANARQRDFFATFISEQTVFEYFEAVQLRGAAREEASEAFLAYQAEATRLFDALRRSVGSLQADLQNVNRQLHEGRTRDLFSGEPAPPYDPDLLRENWRLETARRNAALPYSNAHIAAMRRFIEELERIVAEAPDAFVHPRPRVFIFSRFEPANPGSQINLRVPELEQLVSDSLASGVLRDAVNQLAAADPKEDGQFRAEIRVALQSHLLFEEDRLTTLYLRDLPRARDDAEAFNADYRREEMNDRMQAHGRRWTDHFRGTEQHVESIAGILEEFSLFEHADRWRLEFKRAVADELYKPRWPLEMAGWLRDQPEATDAEIEFAERLLASYSARLGPAQDRAYAAAQRASGKTGFISITLWETREHRECHEAILALYLLGRDTLVQFRKGLSPELQARVGELWLTMDRGIAGPWPLTAYLDEDAVRNLYAWPDMPELWGR